MQSNKVMLPPCQKCGKNDNIQIKKLAEENGVNSVFECERCSHQFTATNNNGNYAVWIIQPS